MAAIPNKLSYLWKELQRRKVLRSLAIYGGSAFIILEAASLIFPRWGLADWTIDLVLWLLILGAFINMIVAWIYDITPGGIQKTKALEEETVEDKPSSSKGWKAATYISLVVIAALVVFNVFISTNTLKAGDIRSLVILPFENYTGDNQLENMVAGMHSMLIGDMGRISGLRVIGKTSSRLYREVDMSAGDIASELNVDAVVEATVMCLGDTVCMQFRLVSTTGEEEQLWVGEYREDKSQILNLYNRVTKQIAEEVLIELTASEEQVFAKNREADRDAIDSYIRSHAYWGDFSAEAFNEAEKFLILAIEKDSGWSTLYAAMAVVWAGRMQMGMVDTETGRKQVNANINRARKLDVDFADSHFINAILFTWPDWEWEKGEKEFLQALAINPNHVMARMYYAHLLMSLQRMDEALAQGKLAVNLDPMNPLVLTLYSVLLKGANRHQEVIEYLEKSLSIDPDHSFTRSQLGRAYYNLEEYEKHLEIQEVSLILRLGEGKVPDLISILREEGRQASYQELADLWGLIYNGQETHPVFMSRRYYWAGEFEKALDELEKAYQAHNPNMAYIGTGSRYEALHDSTRFLDILDSMNLPPPRK